ncbi:MULTISPECIES: hypothetical protein [unclassified Rathayibacter]|uniref:hypothetical protein n=1 Tax=unclassified Rathayibacter TaxID=2609250 RepID=UPI000700328B|nr:MULTISPECIES: hypothetical protein [unclassified Rathayibacter]KQQ05075.1 hypothetical protein ASF42_00135 [Rathayibacter sp. Leaf294]KQS12938.1 hypothetical protein ASG06_00135 [Rathayibacter sp. Leaf185]
MEIPVYLRVLWYYRLAVVGAAVFAVVVALVAHFDLKDGSLQYRGDREYSAAVTVLLGGGPASAFAAATPVVEREQGVTAAQTEDLSATAAVYAYLVSGEGVRSQVADREGPLGERESIGAVRRTSQPSRTEENPGRMSLPVLTIIGTSLDPARAVDLSRTAASVFLDEVAQQQDADGIPADARVTLTVTDEGDAVPGPLGTVALPIGATGVAAFALAILAIFAMHGLRLKRRGAAATVPRPADAAGVEDFAALEDEVAAALEHAR